MSIPLCVFKQLIFFLKDTIEAGGKAVKEQVSKDEADDVKAKLEAVGAEIEVK